MAIAQYNIGWREQDPDMDREIRSQQIADGLPVDNVVMTARVRAYKQHPRSEAQRMHAEYMRWIAAWWTQRLTAQDRQLWRDNIIGLPEDRYNRGGSVPINPFVRWAMHWEWTWQTIYYPTPPSESTGIGGFQTDYVVFGTEIDQSIYIIVHQLPEHYTCYPSLCCVYQIDPLRWRRRSRPARPLWTMEHDRYHTRLIIAQRYPNPGAPYQTYRGDAAWPIAAGENHGLFIRLGDEYNNQVCEQTDVDIT